MSKSNIKENIAILNFDFEIIKFKTKSNNIYIIVINFVKIFVLKGIYSQNTSKADYFSYLTQILKKIQLFEICV